MGSKAQLRRSGVDTASCYAPAAACKTRLMEKLDGGFIAQYDSGTCTNCGGAIESGDRIQDSGYGGQVRRYHHIRCPGASITCSICGGEWYECDCP